MSATKKILATAALAGLLASPAFANEPAKDAGAKPAVEKAGAVKVAAVEKHACAGKNSCKGNGGCKTGDNGCAGKNSCKGKGGCATDGSKKM